jgi:ferredoxin
MSEVQAAPVVKVAAVRALADSWDGGEAAGIAHVAGCQDFGCKTCVVIACATDLRAALDPDPADRGTGRDDGGS